MELCLRYADSVCAKYWPESRDLTVVKSEILSMKNEMSQFASVSRFAQGDPNKLIF